MLEIIHDCIDTHTIDSAAGRLLIAPDDTPICSVCYSLVDTGPTNEYRVDSYLGSRYRSFLCEHCSLLTPVPDNAHSVIWREEWSR